MWRDAGSSADSFYQVKPDSGDDLPKSSFKIRIGKTQCSEMEVGIGKTLGRIQRGGIHPSIRGEVWEFLLGCYDPWSTFEEREQLRQHRRRVYAKLKEDCRDMDSLVGSGRIITAPIVTEEGEPIQDPFTLSEANPNQLHPTNQRNGDRQSHIQDKKVIQWKLTLHQIGLDVLRTDRTLVFYKKKENLSKLWDVLAVYAWIGKDVGYGQGMSDLCSPMIILLEDEADAFWCFERLMRRLRGNFRWTEGSVGMENQLQSLAAVTQIIDPKLHKHLETLGGGDYLFAFRMLMVLFRLYEESGNANDRNDGSKGKVKPIRQFGKYEREKLKNRSKNPQDPLPISVFLVASVLETKSSTEARGLDDVVKILNDMNGNLDAKKACSGAMKLHKKYLKKAKNTENTTLVSCTVPYTSIHKLDDCSLSCIVLQQRVQVSCLAYTTVLHKLVISIIIHILDFIRVFYYCLLPNLYICKCSILQAFHL